MLDFLENFVLPRQCLLLRILGYRGAIERTDAASFLLQGHDGVRTDPAINHGLSLLATLRHCHAFIAQALVNPRSVCLLELILMIIFQLLLLIQEPTG